MDYNTITRRGLIKIAEDFDKDNNNALSNYCESKEEKLIKGWYTITTLELAVERVIDAKNIVTDSTKQCAINTIDKINKIGDILSLK